MKELISKELLSLILDSDINSIQYIRHDERYIEKNCIQFQHYGETESLNKDTLGRLCKEWCMKNGYILDIRYLSEFSKYRCIIQYEKNGLEFPVIDCIPLENLELEAIIKATEWVAKEKGINYA